MIALIESTNSSSHDRDTNDANTPTTFIDTLLFWNEEITTCQHADRTHLFSSVPHVASDGLHEMCCHSWRDVLRYFHEMVSNLYRLTPPQGDSVDIFSCCC